MNFKIGVVLLLIILLTSGTVLAAESTINILGVGIMFIPEEIELQPVDENRCRLLVNDNGVWRGCQLNFIPTPTDVFRDKIKDNTSMIDNLTSIPTIYRESMINEAPKGKLIEDTPLDLQALNTEQSIIKSRTLFIRGLALHFDYYAIDSNDGFRLISVVSVDSNREYWRSKFPQIIANIQR